MNFKKNICGASMVALSLVAGSAHAVLFTSNGVWTSVQENDGAVANVAGLTTNRVSWGTFPDGSQSSAYVFDGAAGDAPTDNSLFALGDFTHENFEIFSPSITGADLALNLMFEGPVTETFSYFFEHNETPNSAPCDPTGLTVCPDVVSIPSAASTETVVLDGIEYLLFIEGFSEDGGSTITPGFITEEFQENQATLYARLEVVPPTEIPLPNALALLGIGLLAFGVRRNRRRA